MDFTTLLGLIGGTITTLSFVPQVVKTWRTRSAGDVSLWMFLLLCTGILIWIIYGFLINSLPVVIANSITFVLITVMLVLKIRYR